jgi:hypothetical protein
MSLIDHPRTEDSDRTWIQKIWFKADMTCSC